MGYAGGCRYLSKREVRQLRARHAAGWTPQALATCYGVSVRTVYRYLAGDPMPLPVRVRDAVHRWARRRGLDVDPDAVQSLAQAVAKVVGQDGGRP
jgi:transcriptional regulator with XRE-family HTH domain